MVPRDARRRFEAAFAHAGLAGDWLTPADIVDASTDPGAYIVCLWLPAAVDLDLPRLATDRLARGWYFYVGSARGSGGMRARLARHFWPSKRPHWHIDHLTCAASRIAAVMLADRTECDIVEQLCASGRFAVAVAGFGSSDCRRCQAHLLRPGNRQG